MGSRLPAVTSGSLVHHAARSEAASHLVRCPVEKERSMRREEEEEKAGRREEEEVEEKELTGKTAITT